MPRSAVAPTRPADLRAGTLRAAFDAERGMLGTSLALDGEELLGPEGIPFLHPWANRLADPLPGADVPRDEHGLPIHGTWPRAWHVAERTARTLVATLDHDPVAVFPYRHRVVHRVRLTPGALRVDTLLTADGGVPVPVAFGFHPYFRVDDDELVALPARRRLLTDELLLPTGEAVDEPAERAPLGGRAFDHGYAVGPGARFAIGTRLEVRFLLGYAFAQVYAPPGAGIICFEPMTAPTNALLSGRGLRRARPGAAAHAAFEIRVG